MYILGGSELEKIILFFNIYTRQQGTVCMYIVWSKMIRNCHLIGEEKLQKNRCQRHFVAQYTRVVR